MYLHTGSITSSGIILKVFAVWDSALTQGCDSVEDSEDVDVGFCTPGFQTTDDRRSYGPVRLSSVRHCQS